MIHFGTRIEPLTDRYLIDSMQNCRFQASEPRCIGEALSFDQPWENLGSLAFSVFEDDGVIKLYYRGYPHDENQDQSEKQVVCLAVSTDGIHFTRSEINRVSYDGIEKNNIIMMASECHMFVPFLDKNPDAKPDEKYKAVSGYWNEGLYVYGSPDGIVWHKLADELVMTDGMFDSVNVPLWDSYAKTYRCYSRFFQTNPKDGVQYRAIQSCTSSDYVHWSAPSANEYSDTAKEDYKEHLYTNATTPIPGAEHMLVSIPMRFHEYRKKVADSDGNPDGYAGLSDGLLMTSRDGVHWDRTLHGAWIKGGLYSHEWTQRSFITAAGIIEKGDSFYFYTEKNYMWDDDGVFVYEIPRYRFMSVKADADGGNFTTPLMHFDTDTFCLNYATSAYGSVVVRVLQEDGTVRAQSDEIYGNEISCPVHFDGLAGTVGRLEFVLNDAEVFAVGADMTKKAN